ncbi:MAG: DNA methyltransferase, partial [Candidatus Ranarchaeia archaeon]
RGNDFITFLRLRLVKIRPLLAQSGSLFLHSDWHMSHYVKILCDDIFGVDNFRNEIIVKRGRKKSLQKQFKKVHRLHVDHDVIFWYSRSAETKYSPLYIPRKTKAKWMGFWSNTDRPTMRYPLLGVTLTRGQWKWKASRALKAVENYQRYLTTGAKQSLAEYWYSTNCQYEFIRKRPSRKYPEYWIPPRDKVLLGTNWMDIPSYSYSSHFPTEKHELLVQRIVENYSDPNDLVLDCFGGSGTTAVVCQRLKRRWLLIDNSWLAVQTTIKRLIGLYDSAVILSGINRFPWGLYVFSSSL